MMENVNNMLDTLEQVIKASNRDEIEDLLKVFPELEHVLDLLDKYEDELTRILKRSNKEIIREFKALLEGVSDSPAILNQMYAIIRSDLTNTALIAPVVAQLSKVILSATVNTLTAIIMNEIDLDSPFEKLSPRTTRWIESWSKELGELMQISNHNAVARALQASLDNGEGIEQTITRLQELPEFDRNRARATAVTEILTANSRSQWEAYNQSPAVTMKGWNHSGGKGIRPRPAHVAMESKPPIPTDEDFIVNGYRCQYPRDTRLPAKERVYCHCNMFPVVDKEILFSPKEYKKMLQEQNLQRME